MSRSYQSSGVAMHNYQSSNLVCPLLFHYISPRLPLIFVIVISLNSCGDSVTLQCSCSFFPMADTEHSSSDETSVDSREETSQESKLEFSEDEETLVIRMFNLVGERWSLIAGRIPGRTAEEIEKYWNTRCSTSE